MDTHDLEKRIRLLERKLMRSERNRKELEDQRARGQVFYRKLHTDLQNMQAQLVHAEKLAALGQLTAGIAHEIKNPLNFINNFAEINEELAEELMEELRKHLADLPSDLTESFETLLSDLLKNSSSISRYGKRADNIVRGMMEHASTGSSEREPVDMNALVASVLKQECDRRKTVEPDIGEWIAFEPTEDLPPISAATSDIAKVVGELLGNAVDAIQDVKEPSILVQTGRERNLVTVSVADNGSGISEEARGKIFEPFFTTKPTGTSTGLGLSLAFDIVVHGHGGSLSFQSPNGSGTVFTMGLPV